MSVFRPIFLAGNVNVTKRMAAVNLLVFRFPFSAEKRNKISTHRLEITAGRFRQGPARGSPPGRVPIPNTALAVP
jgi:hypothetical protein